jgi:hypothetical protein
MRKRVIGVIGVCFATFILIGLIRAAFETGDYSPATDPALFPRLLGLGISAFIIGAGVYLLKSRYGPDPSDST